MWLKSLLEESIPAFELFPSSPLSWRQPPRPWTFGLQCLLREVDLLEEYGRGPLLRFAVLFRCEDSFQAADLAITRWWDIPVQWVLDRLLHERSLLCLPRIVVLDVFPWPPNLAWWVFLASSWSRLSFVDPALPWELLWLLLLLLLLVRDLLRLDLDRGIWCLLAPAEPTASTRSAKTSASPRRSDACTLGGCGRGCPCTWGTLRGSLAPIGSPPSVGPCHCGAWGVGGNAGPPDSLRISLAKLSNPGTPPPKFPSTGVFAGAGGSTLREDPSAGLLILWPAGRRTMAGGISYVFRATNFWESRTYTTWYNKSPQALAPEASQPSLQQLHVKVSNFIWKMESFASIDSLFTSCSFDWGGASSASHLSLQWKLDSQVHKHVYQKLVEELGAESALGKLIQSQLDNPASSQQPAASKESPSLVAFWKATSKMLHKSLRDTLANVEQLVEAQEAEAFFAEAWEPEEPELAAASASASEKASGWRQRQQLAVRSGKPSAQLEAWASTSFGQLQAVRA